MKAKKHTKNYKKKVVAIDEKSKPKEKAKRLRRLRNLANLSRKNLCTLSNINLNTYKGWEIGKYNGLPLDGAKKIINALLLRGVDCSLDWLLHEIGVGPKVSILPNKTTTNKKIKKLSLETEHRLIINEILLFREQFKNTVDLIIDDDGMEPLYNKSEYAAGIIRDPKDIPKLIGINCICQLASGQIILRNLRAGTECNKYSLFCINPATTVENPVIKDIELIGAAPVIRHFRKDPR